MHPLEHFCRGGWKEGNNPTPWFDMKYALQKANDPSENPFVTFLKSKGKFSSLINFEKYSNAQDELLYQKFGSLKVLLSLTPENFLNKDLILGNSKSKKPIGKIRFLENRKIVPSRENEHSFEMNNGHIQLLSKSSFVMSVFDRVFETTDGKK